MNIKSVPFLFVLVSGIANVACVVDATSAPEDAEELGEAVQASACLAPPETDETIAFEGRGVSRVSPISDPAGNDTYNLEIKGISRRGTVAFSRFADGSISTVTECEQTFITTELYGLDTSGSEEGCWVLLSGERTTRGVFVPPTATSTGSCELKMQYDIPGGITTIVISSSSYGYRQELDKFVVKPVEMGAVL